MDTPITPLGTQHRWIYLDNRRRTRWLVLAVVILLSIAPAFLMSEWQLGLIIGVAAGLGMIMVILRRPPFGLALLVIGSILVPIEIGTGTQTGLNFAVLLLPLLIVLWLVGLMVSRRREKLVKDKSMLPVLIFAVVAVISFGIGQLAWVEFAKSAPLRAQLGGLAIFLLSAGAFILMAHQVRDVRWLQRIVWLFLALGGLVVAGEIIPVLGLLTNRLVQSGARGSLLWIWIVALAASQALFNRNLDKKWRFVLGALAIGVIYVNVSQGRRWASGWIPALVALITIVWARAPRAGLYAAMAAGLVGITNLQGLRGFLMAGNNQYSLVTRLEAWRVLGEIIKINPVLGLGPANYYWYTPQYTILGWSVSFNSHNNYVDIIAQTGVVGLLCFLWIAWELGRLAWRLRLRVPEGFPKAYALGALGGLVGTLVAGLFGDWFLPFVYNIGFNGFRASVFGWLFLGGLVALNQITKAGKFESISPSA